MAAHNESGVVGATPHRSEYTCRPIEQGNGVVVRSIDPILLATLARVMRFCATLVVVEPAEPSEGADDVIAILYWLAALVADQSSHNGILRFSRTYRYASCMYRQYMEQNTCPNQDTMRRLFTSRPQRSQCIISIPHLACCDS